mgnify:CR=1 FL=1
MISFIKKTISGLSKTRSKISHIFAGFAGKSYLDEKDLEQLEEILLSADLGWELTENIIDTLKSPDQKESSLSDRFSNSILEYLQDYQPHFWQV